MEDQGVGEEGKWGKSDLSSKPPLSHPLRRAITGTQRLSSPISIPINPNSFTPSPCALSPSPIREVLHERSTLQPLLFHPRSASPAGKCARIEAAPACWPGPAGKLHQDPAKQDKVPAQTRAPQRLSCTPGPPSFFLLPLASEPPWHYSQQGMQGGEEALDYIMHKWEGDKKNDYMRWSIRERKRGKGLRNV